MNTAGWLGWIPRQTVRMQDVTNFTKQELTRQGGGGGRRGVLKKKKIIVVRLADTTARIAKPLLISVSTCGSINVLNHYNRIGMYMVKGV